MNHIKILRKSAGLSQEELAAKLNITQTAISQWETGKTYPDMQQAIAMSNLFDTSVDYLLGQTDIKKSPPELSEGNGIQTDLIRMVDSLTEEEVAKVLDYIQLLLKGREVQPR